jgi:inositol-pentakisphosphate 2-kinase
MHDVEGVFPLLQALLQRCGAQRDSGSQPAAPAELPEDTTPDDSQAAALQQLLALDTEAACGVLREYLIAAASKDCSIMVTLAPVLDAEGLETHEAARLQQDACVGSVLYDECNDRWYRYKIAIVDLDLKPLAKIGVHYELDQAIMACCAGRYPVKPGVT